MLAKKFKLSIQKWRKEKKIISKKNNFFIIKFSANKFNFSRFGVIISSRVSKSAVQRNKIRRIVYNFIRLNKFYKKGGVDVKITVLDLIMKLKKEEIEKEFKKLLITIL